VTVAPAAAVVGCVLVLAMVGCDRKPAPRPGAEPLAATPPPVAEASALAPAAGAAAPAPREGAPNAGEHHAQFARVEFPEVPIRAGATTTVNVSWRAPNGTGVNEEAPFKVRWNRSDALAEAPSDVKATGTSAKNGFRIAVKPLDGAPNATLGGVIDLVVCDVATHSVCVPVRRKVDIEFVVGKSAPAETTVTVDLPQAKVL
jgi:hypothetical protein